MILQSTLRRSLTPGVLGPLLLVSSGAAWLSTRLVAGHLGATPEFLVEVRSGSLLFAGLLALSLAEPLLVAREARHGLLALRVAKGAGFALPSRCLGLTLATVPAVLCAAVAGGGGPLAPWGLSLELAVLAAAGLALGAFLPRAQCVPALWVLAVAGHLRSWLEGSPWGSALSLVLPDLGRLGSFGQRGFGGQESLLLVHAAAWIAAALLLARWRLGRLVARGQLPSRTAVAGSGDP